MSQVDLQERILSAMPAPAPTPLAVASGKASTGPTFSQVLQEKLTSQAARAGIKISSHAQARLTSRQITLSSDDLSKLGEAMTRAAQKGAKESLVLMDRAALVVSVPNRTVITAVDKAALKENIFTNIDSAMIL